jgi:hypothetical protein
MACYVLCNICIKVIDLKIITNKAKIRYHYLLSVQHTTYRQFLVKNNNIPGDTS